jgi:UDP-glucose 4-epimerase
MPKKVLITGGAGFIGSTLVQVFNNRMPQSEITVVDDLSTGAMNNLAFAKYRFEKVSILDYHSLVDVMSGADSVIHLAALGSVPKSVAFPRPTHEANATGTLNVLEAARLVGVGHVVVASSSSVYGANPKLPKSESDWTRPLSPYAVSKLATESYALAYQEAYGLAVIAFRFFNVYGPRQRADHDYAAVIPRFIDASLSGKPLEIHGDGLQTRDFTHVSSVCDVLFQASKAGVTNQSPVNLAYGQRTSLLDLIELLEESLGPLEKKFIDKRPGDVAASQADPALLKRLFPETKIISLREGVSGTIQWFESQRKVK